jgi:ERCC4-type nuclease
MKILIDERENALWEKIDQMPKFETITLIKQVLPLGDIIIQQDDGTTISIIERKTLSDLLASIKDGRYEEQSYRLNGSLIHNHNIIYLIEGDIHKMNQYQSNIFQQKIDKSTLYSSIISLNYFKGFSVLRSFNLDETSMIICNMAHHRRVVIIIGLPFIFL